MKFWTILLFAICIASALQAQPQPPEILWTRHYGASGDESCNSIIETEDGGFLLGGWITQEVNSNHRDAWLLKTNSVGDSIWSWTFGTEERYEECTVILPRPDGSYLAVVGNTSSGLLLILFSQDGDSLWSRSYSWLSNCAVDYTNDGGLVILPFSRLIRCDSAGNILWSREVHANGFVEWEYWNDVIQTSDGGFLIGGSTIFEDDGFTSSWIGKTSSGGILVWEWVLRNSDCDISDVIELADGSFAGVGGWAAKALTVRLDAGGTPILVNNDFGYDTNCLCETAQHNLLVGGLNGSSPDDSRGVREVGVLGDNLWSLHLGEYGASINSVCRASDGGYALAGGTYIPQISEDLCLIRLGEIDPTPAHRVAPDSVSFHTVRVGEIEEIALKIFSIGSDELTISNIILPEGLTSDFEGPVVMPVGDLLDITLQFAPEAIWDYSGELVILNDGWMDSIRVPVEANGAFPPNEEWEIEYTSAGEGEFRSAFDVDGHFILGGYDTGFSSPTSLLMSVSYDGEILWDRSYIADSEFGECRSVCQLSDGGFALGGNWHRDESPWNYEMHVVRTDSNGIGLWATSVYSPEFWNSMFCESLCELSDGCLLLAGGSSNAAILAKLNAQGDSLWVRMSCVSNNYGYPVFSSILALPDGGAIVAGSASVYRSGGGLIMRVDQDGNTLWSQEFHSGRQFFDIVPIDSGGYYLIGDHWNTNANVDFWLMKVSEDGDSLWSRMYGGTEEDACRSAIMLTNGDLLLAGSTKSFGVGERAAWLLRVDSDGNLLWEQHFEGSGNAAFNDIIVTSDGDYLLCGYNNYGSTFSTYPWVLRVSPDSVLATPRQQREPLVQTIQLHPNYPNPFNPTTAIRFDLPKMQHVTLNVYNIMGQTVARLADGVFEAGQHELMFDGSALSSGVYFVAGIRQHVFDEEDGIIEIRN